MDIEAFLPINTKDKVDEIINLILERQESRNVYTDILVHIQKVKMQLYFKEKFDNIKSKLSYRKESVITNAPIQEKKELSYKEAYKEALLKELKSGVKTVPHYISLKSTLPIVKNKKKTPKKEQPKHTLTAIDNNINIHFFEGMTIRQLSEFIGMPLKTLSSIIKQKKNSSILFDNNYSLTVQDIELLSDFLQNAYNTKIRKDKKEELLEKEIATAGYYRKKMEDRFKPSLGQEGNYRKLIYIRTKT
jgi:hypothetical protein